MHAVAEVICTCTRYNPKADIHGIHAHWGTREIKAHLDLYRIHIFAEVPEVFVEL